MLKKLKNRIRLYLYAPHFRWILKAFKNKQFSLLDVGCSSHSVILYKTFFPEIQYEGIDFKNPLITNAIIAKMAKYHEIDLSDGFVNSLNGKRYDCIVMSHVIEHLPNSITLIKNLVELLKPGGYLFIEYPGVNSLKLKSTRNRKWVRGTSNFYDDKTHVAIYKREDLALLLTNLNMIVLKSEIRRNWYFILLSPIILLFRFFNNKGALNGSDLWDFTGFAEVIYAKNK